MRQWASVGYFQVAKICGIFRINAAVSREPLRKQGWVEVGFYPARGAPMHGGKPGASVFLSPGVFRIHAHPPFSPRHPHPPHTRPRRGTFCRLLSRHFDRLVTPSRGFIHWKLGQMSRERARPRVCCANHSQSRDVKARERGKVGS